MSARLVWAVVLLAGSATTQDSVADLVERLGSEDTGVRAAAYRQLQRLRAHEAIPLLAERLPQFPAGGQSQGFYLLQQFPIDQTRGAYRRLLARGGPFLRAASAAALYRGGDRTVVPALTEAIAAAADEERWLVLGRVYGVDDPRVAAAVRAVVRPGVRYDGVDNALWHLLLAEKSRSQASIEAAVNVLEDGASDARSRAVAAAYLLAAGEVGHSVELARALADEPSMVTRIKRYLDRAPRVGDEVLDALLEILAAAGNSVQVTYPAQILEKHAPGKSVPALQRLLGSDSEPVRKAALSTLSTIPGALEAKALRQMLGEGDVESVLIAADILRRMDDLSGLDRVLEIARAGGPNRAEAVRVLGAYRVRAVVPALLDALADLDVAVRRNALHGLGQVLRGLFPYRRFDLESTGYRPDAPAEQRAEGLRVLQAWWEANE